MIQLNPDEKILFVIRRHWYVYIRLIMFGALLSLLPLILLFFASFDIAGIPEDGEPIIGFALSLYAMSLLTYCFIVWATHYLDAWIITNQRLIDIEQVGLFYRKIAEIALERVQNVSIEIPGFVPTFLRFGNLEIQTAGEGNFTIKEVPDCYHAKELIIQQSRRIHELRAHTPNGHAGL